VNNRVLSPDTVQRRSSAVIDMPEDAICAADTAYHPALHVNDENARGKRRACETCIHSRLQSLRPERSIANSVHGMKEKNAYENE